MNRPLTLLLALGLTGGCAASARAPATHSHRGGYARPGTVPQASIRLPRLAAESTTASASMRRLSRLRAPRDVQKAPQPSPKRSGRVAYKPSPGPASSGSGGSRGTRSHRRSVPRKGVRTVSTGSGGTTGRARRATPTLARGAKVGRSRLIIYRGTLVLRVFKASDAASAAQKAALQAGAYIQSRNNRQLVIRVPVDRFHELMALLESVGEVGGKSIAARDVTQRFYDVSHRLKAAEAVLLRLKALLAKAKNVQDSLMIEREMSRLLVRIERFKGMLRYLQHHASLSTIVVHFRVKPRYTRPIRSSWRSPFGWVKSLGLWRMMRF